MFVALRHVNFDTVSVLQLAEPLSISEIEKAL